MDPVQVRRSIEAHGQESFSRSSGPGGQNVNKVSTKVLLRIDLTKLEGVSEADLQRLKEKLSSRLTPEGELQIQVQDDRSQAANRETAVGRLTDLIVRALHREKPRRKTKPTRASQERRITAKKIASGHRTNRRIPTD